MSSRWLTVCWAVAGATLMALAGGLAWISDRFGYAHEVIDMPVLWFAGGYVLAGAILFALVFLVRATVKAGGADGRTLLFFVLAAGVVMRLALVTSEPVLEDDYQRYLWDGGVTAAGLNPYKVAPTDAMEADPERTEIGRLARSSGPVIGRLARSSGPVIGRINHPDLRTIYPPVAQGAFALAHWLQPWSLTAWRLLCLLLDGAVLALLLVLLRDLGRSPLWAALYWWNPVVLKELVNAGHMEALVMPLVLLTLVLAVRGRLLWATGALVLAAGAKIWPALLFPLIWRPLIAQPARLAVALALAVAAAALFALPVLLAGLDASSGFVAYAQKWRTNSALMPELEAAARGLLATLGVESLDPALMARGLIATILGALALGLNRTPFADTETLVRRAAVLVSVLFLLSPAQFPWYYLWVLPLLALRPSWGLLLAGATLPLYYTAFHFMARDQGHIYYDTIVWLIWLPVWAVLAAELWPLRHTLMTRTRRALV